MLLRLKVDVGIPAIGDMIAVRLASTPVCHVCCADEASLQTALYQLITVDDEQAVQKQEKTSSS